MVLKSIIGTACIGLAVISASANAVVIRPLNGINYKWMELTATVGMSRVEVEAQLSDSNSALYGYEYASRELFDDLLHSYASWDGISGWHAESGPASGMAQYISDFGSLVEFTYTPDTLTDVHGSTYEYDFQYVTQGYYGVDGECVSTGFSCLSNTRVLYFEGAASATYQVVSYGWDSAAPTPVTDYFIPTPKKKVDDTDYSDYGSHLVKAPAVPIPASIWLFGSGLIGLIGIARRKKS